VLSELEAWGERALASSSSSDLVEALRNFAYALGNARPSMAASLSSAAAVVAAAGARAAAGGGGAAVAQAVVSSARAERQRRSRSAAELGSHLRSALPPSAGTLVTLSYSSLVAAALEGGPARDIVSAEGRPLYEGVRLARRLQTAGHNVRVCTDAAVGAALSGGGKGALVIGADALHSNGVVNKVGTHMAALAAREAGVPVFVVTTRDKVLPAGATPAPSESKSGAEVTHGWPPAPDLDGSSAAPAALEADNVYFEVTPLELVTGGVVTEQGIWRADDGGVARSIEAEAQAQAQLRAAAFDA